MVSKRVRGDKGFTLIEVMVALTIISVLTAALVPMVVSSIQRIKLTGQKAQELSEQQGIMERRLSGETITHQVYGFREDAMLRSQSIYQVG